MRNVSTLFRATCGGLCVLVAAAAVANASTRLRVSVQGWPNTDTVRWIAVNVGSTVGPEDVAAGLVTPQPGRLILDGNWVLIVFNVNSNEVIAADRFTVGPGTPPTINATVARDTNNHLKVSWDFQIGQSYIEAYGKPEKSQ